MLPGQPGTELKPWLWYIELFKENAVECRCVVLAGMYNIKIALRK